MCKFKSVVLTVTTMLLVVPNFAYAESWICENSNLIREINVERETAAAAPCSVVYDKSSEGGNAKVLWTANNEGAYCDEKANGLAEKLKGYGWSCTAF